MPPRPPLGVCVGLFLVGLVRQGRHTLARSPSVNGVGWLYMRMGFICGLVMHVLVAFAFCRVPYLRDELGILTSLPRLLGHEQHGTVV